MQNAAYRAFPSPASPAYLPQGSYLGQSAEMSQSTLGVATPVGPDLGDQSYVDDGTGGGYPSPIKYGGEEAGAADDDDDDDASLSFVGTGMSFKKSEMGGDELL